MRHSQLELVGYWCHPRIVLCFEDLLLTSQIQITWKGFKKWHMKKIWNLKKIKKYLAVNKKNTFHLFQRVQSKYFRFNREEKEEMIVPTMMDAAAPYSFQWYCILHSRLELRPLFIIFIHWISFKQDLLADRVWDVLYGSKFSQHCQNNWIRTWGFPMPPSELPSSPATLKVSPSCAITHNFQLYRATQQVILVYHGQESCTETDRTGGFSCTEA